MREMLATKDWVLVNSQGREVVEGGPYTREDPATGKLSCLDLSIVSRELWPFVQKLVIDRERNFTPARPMKKRGKYKLIYTDHFSTLLSLKDLPRRQKDKEEKRVMWNLAKQRGWEDYKKLTNKYNKYSEKLKDIVEDKSESIEDIMNRFDNVLNQIKFKAFGKVTINKRVPKTKRKRVQKHSGKEGSRRRQSQEAP